MSGLGLNTLVEVVLFPEMGKNEGKGREVWSHLGP